MVLFSHTMREFAVLHLYTDYHLIVTGRETYEVANKWQ